MDIRIDKQNLCLIVKSDFCQKKTEIGPWIKELCILLSDFFLAHRL